VVNEWLVDLSQQRTQLWVPVDKGAWAVEQWPNKLLAANLRKSGIFVYLFKHLSVKSRIEF
jgi:hypothetical protein